MILSIENLEKEYKDFSLNCSIQLEEGMITGVIGANGAGKSTLFKSILGLISFDGGSIQIFEKDVKKLSLDDREKIGAVLSEGGFSTYLTIKGMIPILKAFYHDFDATDFTNQCERFQLPLNKKLKDMSTGMKAKLNILVAMSHNARLLILDEPTAGLDVIARNEILDMMRNYMEEGNRSILISSHISSDLEGFCDDIYMIHKGRIMLHEDTDTLLDTYGIVKLDQEQFKQIGKEHISYKQKESYGYQCLTKKRQFFIDNYPEIVVEKGRIDDILTMMERGEKV